MSATDSPQPSRTTAPSAGLAAPGLARRLACGGYDALLVASLCILATFCIVAFARGKGVDSFYAGSPGAKLFYQLGLLALGYAFFGGFWTHGGQTLGMRAWRVRVICMDGAGLGWYRALLRYLTMLIPWLLLVLGSEFLFNAQAQPEPGLHHIAAPLTLLLALLGFIWPRLDTRGFAWHDHLSGTRVVLLSKEA